MATPLNIAGFTEEQRRLFNDANQLGSGVPIINSSTLSGGANFNLPTFNPTRPDEIAGAVSAIPSIESILSAVNQKSAAERNDASFRDEIMASLAKLSEREGATLTAENTAGLPQKMQQLQDLSGRLESLRSESLAIPLQLQEESTGLGRTSGGVEPIQTARLRNNAIQALSVSAQAQALQGNIALARQQVDRAIALEFEPEERKLAFLKQAYEFNKDILAREDKKRSEALAAALDERERLLTEQKTQREGVYNIMTTIAKYGAPQSAVDLVRGSKTIEEAISRAAPYMQDPKAKIDLQTAILDVSLKKAQLAKVQKETQLLGEPTAKERKEIAAALKEAESSIPTMQNKIAAVDTLKKHPGMNSRVGPSPFTRGPQGILGTTGRALSVIGIPSLVGAGIDTLTGAGQDFAGGIHKLTSGLNLQELIEAKARGATFGALSNQELRVLASAATAISDWEIKKRVDGEDIPTGFWDIDEASFQKELDTIKNLTQEAIRRKGGSVIDSEEQELIDSIYQVGGFDPSF